MRSFRRRICPRHLRGNRSARVVSWVVLVVATGAARTSPQMSGSSRAGCEELVRELFKPPETIRERVAIQNRSSRAASGNFASTQILGVELPHLAPSFMDRQLAKWTVRCGATLSDAPRLRDARFGMSQSEDKRRELRRPIHVAPKRAHLPKPLPVLLMPQAAACSTRTSLARKL